MEYIEGQSIDTWCAGMNPSLPALLRLFSKVIQAVGYAHARGVIHRDIKPGNIMVSLDGEPKLLDFGIAALLGERDGLTQPNQVLLTPEYASPEQLRNEELAESSDIYSLGLVLLQLLTRLRPRAWDGEPLSALAQMIANGRSLPFFAAEAMTEYVGTEIATREPTHSDWSSQTTLKDQPTCPAAEPEREPVPEALGHVLRTALAADRQRRYSTCADLIGDLNQVLSRLPDEKRKVEKTHDALFWYMPEDETAVAALAGHLKEDGLTVWLDRWNLRPGIDPIQATGAALETARTCLVCLGPGDRGPWLDDTVSRDRLAFLAGELRILPVLLPGAVFPKNQSELPSFLRGLAWATFPRGLADGDMERLSRLVGEAHGQDERVPTGVCPFRGLEVFREQDRDFFFGREGIAQRIEHNLANHRFIGVLGPSGSGKSSVVQAGVLPQLREAGILLALFTPSVSPLEELAHAL